MLTIKMKSQVCMLAAVRKETLICLLFCVVQKRQVDGASLQGGKIQIFHSKAYSNNFNLL